MVTILRLRLCALAAFVLIASCDNMISKAEPTTDEMPLSSIIQVSALPAGPISTDTSATVLISARVPTNLTNRSVSFSSSSGVFVETSKNAVVVLATPALPDSMFLVAKTRLRDNVAEHVVVRATVGTTYYDTVGVTFVKP